MDQDTHYSMNWDLDPYFKGLHSPEYQQARQQIEARLQTLTERFEALEPLHQENAATWAQALEEMEDLDRFASHAWSFLSCVTATRAGDQEAQRQASSLLAQWAAYEKVQALVELTLSQASQEAYDALLAQPSMAPVTPQLERWRSQGAHKMPLELEKLASDMEIDGLTAWGELYKRITGTLEFDLEVGQEKRRVPLAHKRSLTQDSDPATRKAALEGSNQALEEIQHVFGGALNAIAGSRLTLQRWRKVDHFLTPALQQSRVSRATLEAMREAIAQSQELPRRYLRRKAQLMGVPRLGFQDLEAPLPLEESQTVPWDEGCQRIIDAFSRHNPELGDFARMALESKWVDAAPGAGRSPGGFCTSSFLLGQSRIFMTYRGTLGDVQTLAHELGHAFHNYVMRDMRPWARLYPMTLAESASTYAEAVLAYAMLDDPGSSDAARAVLLNGSLERSEAFLLNIPMRFDFEVAFYEERSKGPVSIERTKELMLQAQRANYGDVLDSEQMDPWFWASKGHFFMTYTNFYNYPYTFGYLFSMAVLMRAQQEGPSFFQKYKALLRDTGLSHTEEVARRHLGVSLEDPAFWLGPMELIKRDLEQFEALVPGLLAKQP